MHIELPDARANNHRSGERDNSAHRVDDTRAREVNRTVPEAPIYAALREPASTPHPVRIETIRQCNPEAVKNEILP